MSLNSATRLGVFSSIIFAILFAGCTNSDGPKPGPGAPIAPDSSGTGTTDGPGPTPPTLPAPPRHELILTNCVAWQAFRNYPGPAVPAQPPEGWTTNAEDPLISISLVGLRCERFALDQFERGPFYMVFDVHGNVNVPPDCANDLAGITKFWALENLVVNDADVAEYLALTYELPAWTASFSESDQDTAAISLHTWTWAGESQESSTMTLLDYKQNAGIPTWFLRLFWRQGTGISSLELAIERDGAVTNLEANGTVRPPFLLAQDTAGTFIGQGDWFTNAQGSGRVTMYRDLECKEPRP